MDPRPPADGPTATVRASSVDVRLASMVRRFSRRARVLVVDDGDTGRQLLRAVLVSAGIDVVEAASGEEALRIARAESPDLVLLDVVLPGMDGFAVCEGLAKDPATADIPVIFLSARSTSSDRVRGLELGAVDYVTKPFSRAEVLARVRTHLELRMLSRSLQEVNRELLRNQRRLEEDLRAAAIIQRTLIPGDDLPSRFDELDLAWVFRPSDAVGGDVFHVHRLDSDHLGIWIVDVSGHGVPAAMVTVSVAQRLTPQAGGFLKDRILDPPYYRLPGPAELLRRVDDDFPVERYDKYFTMAYLLLDLRRGILRHARAGHPSPVLVRREGGTELLEEGGTIIGVGGELSFEEGEKRLEPGDRIFLFTDGLHEHPDPSGARYGTDRLHAAIEAGRTRPLPDACGALVEDVERFAAGRPADDDLTVLALEYRGPSARRSRA
jgi:sigma-B regulation protein RsbU (phosphoserine phosphatase)